MRVVERAGLHYVHYGADEFGPFKTNAKAWRWIDRQMNEPVNRKQDAHDWSFRKGASGE